MVHGFVIDPMHCISINTMRRTFSYLKGVQNLQKGKMTNSKFMQIGDRFAANRFPVEFHRQPRSFIHLSHYKASEMRMLLLYGFEMFVKGLMDEKLEKMMLLLAVATRIISDKRYVSDAGLVKKASNMYSEFVELGQQEFGVHFVTLNVHLLKHITDNVSGGTVLDKQGCFKFENTLKSIKALCRGTKKPMLTLCNQLGTEFVIESNIGGKHKNRETEPAVISRCYKKIRFTECRWQNQTISSRCPDCYVSSKPTNILNNVHIYKIQEVLEIDNELYLQCNEIPMNMLKPAWILNPEDSSPEESLFDSRMIGIYMLSAGREIPNKLVYIPLKTVDIKYVRVKSGEDFVFYPLLPL